MLRAEIVNCDSLQVYRYFDIGTAKASLAERSLVPHHLFDILNPDELFTAGDYARLARTTLHEIAERGNVPIVVGGTGFYLRAMLDGLFDGPARDDAVRHRLRLREEKRPGSLHRILNRLDPTAAQRIHPNDLNKLIRALEIILVSRQPVTSLYEAGSAPLEGFTPLLIGLDPPRAQLYQVLNERSIRMFENGLLAEVESILARGYPSSLKPFTSLGYAQAIKIIQGEMTHSAALEEMQTQTRHYAKRQLTWFKKDTRVSWIPEFGHSPQVFDNTRKILTEQASTIKRFFL